MTVPPPHQHGDDVIVGVGAVAVDAGGDGDGGGVSVCLVEHDDTHHSPPPFRSSAGALSPAVVACVAVTWVVVVFVYAVFFVVVGVGGHGDGGVACVEEVFARY